MTGTDLTAAAASTPLNALDLAFARFLQQAQASSDPRHGWLAALVSHQFGRGHACLDLQLLRQSGVQALGWEPALQPLLPDDLAHAAATLPWTQGGSSPLVLDAERLYLRRNWQAEQVIRASILARLAEPCPVPDTLATALDALFGAVSEVGHAPDTGPDWQKVACALAARRRLTLITGGPGTGKTTTVVRLLALLQSQALSPVLGGAGAKPLRMALAAPTGKAAARLGESVARAVQQLPIQMQAHLPTQAQTLHKLLQVRAAVQATPAPELALDVVVVDEASMIDLALMERLLAAVPVTASLILLGDKDQLASVEAGAVMGQLCETAAAGHYDPETLLWVHSTTGQDIRAWAGPGSALAQQTVMLRHSHRFAADSQIGQWASAVNAGARQRVHDLSIAVPEWQASPLASVTRLARGGSWGTALATLVRAGWQGWHRDLQALTAASLASPDKLSLDQASEDTALPDRALPIATSAVVPVSQGLSVSCDDAQALQLLRSLGQFQVLCALREGPWGVLALNASIARALGFTTQGWYAGRPVMVTRNDYNLKLMNGDVGLCLPTASGLRVAFADASLPGSAGVRWVLPSRLDAVETVFAMTVHKSQGSEFDHVALVLPDKMAPVLTRELLYTGITRAKQQLTLVLPQAGVLRQAVDRKILRSGGLAAV
ncbi:MAG: exodeoxyribonuclease V subunit alpha [Comamonadaceae bacterium]|nr:exodeoxyribonuclease V subunit alpha [Comamonadaceae bacterium]